MDADIDARIDAGIVDINVDIYVGILFILDVDISEPELGFGYAQAILRPWGRGGGAWKDWGGEV